MNEMLNFISFGSGSSGNCYYLATETDRLLIDAGVGIRTLKK
ncbi:MAG: MBL fold metallo-hydrolase, partial [Prevotella sp.]|nr:MBL fold metallo-hydrolase [Prevotella sp.]